MKHRRNKFGMLEHTSKTSGRTKFFNKRSDLAKFLRKLRGITRAGKKRE